MAINKSACNVLSVKLQGIDEIRNRKLAKCNLNCAAIDLNQNINVKCNVIALLSLKILSFFLFS